jgi:glycosyltransferase involved in cell wall biosynthesis
MAVAEALPAARPRLTCLLPVRNGAADLPGWFESVERFADAVVALDDGSSDDTAAVLRAHPLVDVLLQNERRESYRGWDDAGNRSRVLAAAAATAPDWVLFLDADERVSPDDAVALRRFVDREAVPGCAYGMRIYSMLAEPGTYDRHSLWVYRLFAFAPGQVLRPRRLHDVPVPRDIRRSHWIRTTLRIQHIGGSTPARRSARYAKYEQADPERRFQASYEGLIAEPGPPRRWVPRDPGAPVLAVVSPVSRPVHEGPDVALTGIVISHDDEHRIERAVRSVVEQECPEPFEVIVVVSGTDATAEVVRSRFPDVRVVELGPVALPGAARNAGLLRARGEFVSFPGSHVELPPGSLAARLRAHRAGHAMVTGTMLNGTRSPAGWASYFLDHAAVLPGRPTTELKEAPSHCSYVRSHLFDVAGFREDLRAGEDTIVNLALWQAGRRALRARDVRLVHNSPCTRSSRLAAHHFRRGRALGRILLEDLSRFPLPLRAYFAVRFAALYLPKRLLSTSRAVHRWGGPLRRVYRRVLPLVVLGMLAAHAGLMLELTLAAVRLPGKGLRASRQRNLEPLRPARERRDAPEPR